LRSLRKVAKYVKLKKARSFPKIRLTTQNELDQEIFTKPLRACH
jgi:hypothetical protein